MLAEGKLGPTTQTRRGIIGKKFLIYPRKLIGGRVFRGKIGWKVKWGYLREFRSEKEKPLSKNAPQR